MTMRYWRDRLAAAREGLWTGAIPDTAADAFVLACLEERARVEEGDELFGTLFNSAVKEGRVRNLDTPKSKAGRRPNLDGDVELLRDIRREFLPRKWFALFLKAIGAVGKDQGRRRYNKAAADLAGKNDFNRFKSLGLLAPGQSCPLVGRTAELEVRSCRSKKPAS